jgi:Pectate lyase superfamily protein
MPYAPTVDLGRFSSYTTNVKDFGAVGDGLTDDTNAIAAAISAASSGGKVLFPQGTYVTKTQLLYSRVHLQGAGIETTILLLKNGTNGDLFQGSVNGYTSALVNVAATNASGSAGGIYNWSLQDITLDGNKAGQSGGPAYCLRQYGFGFILLNVRMRNGYSGGMYSDWNGGGSSGADSMEAQIVNLKIHDCNGLGLEWAGPHDSHFVNVLSYANGSTNFHIGPNATAVLMENCHGFSPGSGVSACSFLIEGGYGQYCNCVSEGSDTCNTVILAGDIDWIGSHIFGIVGNVSLQKGGLQLGQQTSQTPFAGSVYQSGGVSTAWQTSGCLIDGNFNLNNSFAINFANETNNVIRANCYNTDGNIISGNANIQTSFQIYMNGLAADGSAAKGGGIYHAIKANKAWGLGDRTQDIININTYNKKFELVNGTVLRTYTDTYSTESFVTLGDSFGTVRFAGDNNATIARRAAGVLAFSGTIALNQGTVQVIATSGTVTMANLGIVILNPATTVTGIKLAAGTYAGQMITVINKSAFSVTFDIAANSFIADGASDVISANTAAHLYWSNIDNLWYRCV